MKSMKERKTATTETARGDREPKSNSQDTPNQPEQPPTIYVRDVGEVQAVVSAVRTHKSVCSVCVRGDRKRWQTCETMHELQEKLLEVYGGRVPGRSLTSMEPLVEPADNAPSEVWEAYRDEKRRRKTLKGMRKGRIERREHPHDAASCEVCKGVVVKERYPTPREVSERSLVGGSHVYRVFSDDPKQARGRKTLATLRRIAHDGMGISLDELAALVLD